MGAAVATFRADLPFNKPNRGSYSANLIGTIRSHLEGLQGYDVMALELIQNADDAGSNGQGKRATEIIFDVMDEGLIVRNDGAFTYCGELHERPCPDEQRDGYGCDYHRITEVASGGKLSRSDNIGRFGIGFVSTYQIADHPEIHSAGVKLTLFPEDQEWRIDATDECPGTEFFLPWASDPTSKARVRLGASAVTPEHIEELIEDFKGVLRRALLFLRHLKRAELRRNGASVLSVELARDRDDEAELLVTFMPAGTTERWLILRADAAEAVEAVYDRYPRLETLARKTQVSVAIRVEPQPLPDGQGILYAYLPTEQATGFPVHVNADFFPESDRKAVIFSGSQHQQAWNELLIVTAANALAQGLEGLRDKLGATHLWAMLSQALLITQDKTGRFPQAFHAFWDAFKASVDNGAEIALAADDSFQRPSRMLYPKQPPEPQQLAVLQELGGNVIAEVLRPYRNALLALGTAELTFDRLLTLMEASIEELPEQVEPESPERFESFYLPLWALVEGLFPEGTTASVQQLIGRLKAVPFIVDPNLYPYKIDGSYRGIFALKSQQLAPIFPASWFTSDYLAQFPRLTGLVTVFQLKDAVEVLYRRLVTDNEPVHKVLPVDRKELKQLYSILATLEELFKADQVVHNRLRTLPIWMTGKGFVPATHALLPGDFTDPTGQAELINQKLLDAKALAFVQDKLGVKRQTIEAFVRTVVPRFIGPDGPKDVAIYKTLITTLANHAALLDNDELRALLAGLRLVPTRDGGWATPTDTYFPTQELKEILGDAAGRWVHVSRIPDGRAVRSFLESLGVRRTPSPLHLAERIVEIAEAGPPTESARKESEKAFYALCELYDHSDPEDSVEDAVALLSGAECLPGDGEADRWFLPDELYAPFRHQAFESQAYSIDFRNTKRLSADLLKELGVSDEPETAHVVNHLIHCAKNQKEPHFFVWQILNERAKKDDPDIQRLRGQPCIYDQTHREFLRPNQVYLLPQQLGRYAYALPAALSDYKALFNLIGVKESPAAADYVDILLDIVKGNWALQLPLDAADRKVYEICMSALSQAWQEDCVDPANLGRLRTAPTLLNVPGRLCHPDEVLLHDSEWHLQHFGGELDAALCKLSAPELGPFFEVLGARRLSEVAVVELDFVHGAREPEDEVAELLAERADILVRMLYAKPRATRDTLYAAITRLEARSHETVRIKASVFLGEEPISAEPIPVRAFYDATRDELILARPVNERSWLHVFTALLHQLMPEEPASAVSHLALALDPLMSMSHAEAEDRLAEARIPFLEIESEDDIDLTSPNLDGFGEEPDEVEEEGSKSRREEQEVSGKTESQGERESGYPDPNVGSTHNGEATDGASGRDVSKIAEGGGEAEKPGSTETTESGSAGPPLPGRESAGRDGSGHLNPSGARIGRGSQGAQRGRSSHKSSWDRQLISYVRQRQNETDPGDEDGKGSEDAAYKLAVEAAARAAVCNYEEERGRKPEEMAQTHPGYDIISRNSTMDNIERYIEVKGTTGEWSQLGVGLSRLQFTNAQESGDQYWLYVVEFALEENGARVHAIQSPALKVDHFMFDGKWRHVATDETADPTLRFVAGARIDCGVLGEGMIADVQQKGQSRLLIVHFDDGRKRALPLNLKTMRIMEDTDGQDDS